MPDRRMIVIVATAALVAAPEAARAASALLAQAAPAVAAVAAPTRLALADAVKIASKQAPAAAIAGFETRQVEARRQQARGALLPSISGTASESNRTFNKNTLGFSFPNIPGVPPSPDLVGPFDTAD